jgi:hypothetical protein
METIGKIIYQIDAKELEEILQKVIIKEMDKLKIELMKEPKFLNRNAAAIKMGVCPNTISSLVKRGVLVNRSKGRNMLLLESDLTGIKTNRYTKYND